MTTKFGASILIGSLTSAGLALLPFSTALAETATGTLGVSAQVVATCSVVGSPTLSFGVYNPVGGDLPGTASIVVHCTTPTSVTVSLDGGDNEQDGKRHMKDGQDNELEYGLYQDAAYGTEFGGDTGPGEELVITGLPEAGTTVDVFGRIPGNQTVPTGDYDDLVGISIEF